jgi:pimeloyl-ACP methyl ester carboxylesterase
MAIFERDGVRIHYEVSGDDGPPLLLFAPGGMQSVAQLWRERPGSPERLPWIDPTTALADAFRVVAMDQRNAGQSSAPISGSDGWQTYTSDHIALCDHLGFDRVHLMGGCIGSSYALSFCRVAPERVRAAVLQNPIGLTADNRPSFYEMFDTWAAGMPGDAAAKASFREHMYGGDFVFSVDREFVRQCRTPLLILAGNDHYHPRAVAEEIAELAPDAELVLEWGGRYEETEARIRAFLLRH